MLEWFSRWTPEQVIGLFTALGIFIGALTLKPKSKAEEVASESDMRLSHADRMLIDEIAANVGVSRLSLSQVQGEVLSINAKLVELSRQSKEIVDFLKSSSP